MKRIISKLTNFFLLLAIASSVLDLSMIAQMQ